MTTVDRHARARAHNEPRVNDLTATLASASRWSVSHSRRATAICAGGSALAAASAAAAAAPGDLRSRGDVGLKAAAAAAAATTPPPLGRCLCVGEATAAEAAAEAARAAAARALWNRTSSLSYSIAVGE